MIAAKQQDPQGVSLGSCLVGSASGSAATLASDG